MIPLHFGTRQRTLFGAYTPAAGEVRRRGVVICNPWGPELLRAHRSLRLLADSLSGVGLDVLRFDYYGTGDSWGDDLDVSLTGCVDDTRTAVGELRDVAGLDRVDLVGLRLGAYLAARSVAAERAARVVLWDPVVSGQDFLAELDRGRRTAPADGSPAEISGFRLSPALWNELESASIEGLPGGEATVLVAVSQALADPAIPWGVSGREVSVSVVESPPCWVEERDFGAGAVPVNLLGIITEWLR